MKVISSRLSGYRPRGLPPCRVTRVDTSPSRLPLSLPESAAPNKVKNKGKTADQAAGGLDPVVEEDDQASTAERVHSSPPLPSSGASDEHSELSPGPVRGGLGN